MRGIGSVTTYQGKVSDSMFSGVLSRAGFWGMPKINGKNRQRQNSLEINSLRKKREFKELLCLMRYSSTFLKKLVKTSVYFLYCIRLGLGENFWFCISYRIWRIALYNIEIHIHEWFFLVVWYVLKAQTWIPRNLMHFFSVLQSSLSMQNLINYLLNREQIDTGMI